MFEPIAQLQQLRRRALFVRAVSRVWAGSGKHQHVAETVLLTWRISRVVGGWLIGHPNAQYHPSRSPLYSGLLACAALAVRASLWSDAARTRWLSDQLRVLGRECADIRAVTSSVSINEMLARHQPALSALYRLVRSRGLEPVRLGVSAAGHSAPRAGVGSAPSCGADTWPFLSI